VVRLAALLHVKRTFITTALSSEQNAAFAPVPLQTAGAPVSDADVLYIEQNPEEFPGVTVTKSSTRSYPQGSLASQVIGYVNPIQADQLTLAQFKGLSAQAIVGQSGLEEEYNSVLQGKPGLETFEVDPNGVPLGELSSAPAVNGDTLVLNMDGALERTLTNALDDQLVALRYGAKPVPAPWGAAVVLDTQTGAVLAMASAPGYNDNLWEPGISVAAYAGLNPPGCATGAAGVGCPLANYATQGLQPPGSTFKLATATAALDRGLINQYYSYDDTGSFTIGNPPLTLHDSDNEALGYVDVSTALSESSDVFFYNLGWLFWLERSKYGETPIQKVAEEYGIGAPSGIDLPGVLSGQVDSPQLRVELHRQSPSAFPYTTYYAGDNVEMAFGQGETLTTPLELAEAYGTFANGGTRYAPELAGAIVSPSGKLVKRIAPKVVDKVPLPPLTWQPIFSGLEGAVQAPKGTAYAAFQGFDFTNWDIGGKTGTATTCPNDLNCQPTSWFVGIGGPRGHTPRYVVAVEVNEGGFGAAASAPIARKVFDYLYAHQPPALDLPSSR
jgi:penicillin-binding protein 2